MSFFLAKPHVENGDGEIITPDILIDRLFAFRDGKATPVSVGALSHDVVAQVANRAGVTPAVVVIAAGAGPILSPAIVLDDGRVHLARKAWRLRHLGDAADAIDLELNSEKASLDDNSPVSAAIASAPGSTGNSLARGMAVIAAIESLSHNQTAPCRLTVTMSDRTTGRALRHSVDIVRADAEMWERRPQPEYSTGPQKKSVQHYT